MTDMWVEFLGKKVQILQKDGFIKDGIFRGGDDNFILLEFSNGSPVAIGKDMIVQIKLIGDEM